MMRFRHVVVASGALAMVALAGSLAFAQAPEGRGGQRGAAPPEPHNLKVLPPTTTTAQILPTMRAFSAALGTNCGYCHVWTAPGAPTNDYASDEKTTKLVARVMMQMAGEINQKLAANIKKPADQITRVQCMTCHRGAAIPTLPPPATPAGAAPAGGPPPTGR
jgi:Photosynthetic reaction centre cytochrome C subunit